MKRLRRKVVELKKAIGREHMLDEVVEDATKWDDVMTGEGDWYDFLRKEYENIKPISREELERIIVDEGLSKYVKISFNPENIRQDYMVAFFEKNNTYYVYGTGERASGHAYEFKDEEIALGAMLDSIRGIHELLKG